MANRFWVGGNATWDATAGTKWATISGGAGGSAVPTAADDVFLDNGTGTGNVTLSSSSVCRSLNCTSYTGTLTHPASTTLNIGDATAGASNIALKLVSGMIYTLGSTTTSAITFVSTSSTQQTIDFAGKINGNVTWNGTNGSWILASALVGTSSTTDYTLTAGSLDTGNFNITGRHFLSNNSNTRSLSLGSSIITVSTNGAGNIWDFTTVTNLTFNPGTSTVSASGTNTSFVTGGKTFYNVSVIGSGGGAISLQNSCTFTNLTLTSASNTEVQLANDFTISGLLTINSSVSINMGIIRSTVVGSQRTLTAASTSISNICLMDIVGAGTAAPFDATSNSGNAGGNSNITFTNPRTLYWVNNGTTSFANTSSWSTSSGGANGQTPPLPQDTAIFDANSITSSGRTLSITGTAVIPTIDLSNVLNSPTVSFGNINATQFLVGNLKVKSGMTVSGTATVGMAGRGSQTLDTQGVTITNSINIIAPGGTYTLLNDLTITLQTFTVGGGTFDANGFNVTASTFNSNNSVTRTINMGSGIWTINGTSGTILNLNTATNLTLNPGTSTINFNTGAAGTRTYAVNGAVTLGNVKVSSGSDNFSSSGLGIKTQNLDFTGFTGTWNADGSTINGNLTLSPGMTLSHGSPSNITIVGNFIATGTSGNIITIKSSSNGTARPLSKSSGVVSGDYLSIRDSTATGGAYWAAGANSTSVSNNSGWVFGAASFPLSLSDSSTSTDATAKSVTKVNADSVTPSDTPSKTLTKILSDIASTIDYASHNFFSRTYRLIARSRPHLGPRGTRPPRKGY